MASRTPQHAGCNPEILETNQRVARTSVNLHAPAAELLPQAQNQEPHPGNPHNSDLGFHQLLRSDHPVYPRTGGFQNGAEENLAG